MEKFLFSFFFYGVGRERKRNLLLMALIRSDKDNQRHRHRRKLFFNNNYWLLTVNYCVYLYCWSIVIYQTTNPITITTSLHQYFLLLRFLTAKFKSFLYHTSLSWANIQDTYIFIYFDNNYFSNTHTPALHPLRISNHYWRSLQPQ